MPSAGSPGSTEGSSPLTRGKPVSLTDRVCNLGLIPAHAGKTGQSGRRRGPPAAHPRSRGENPKTPHENTPRNGSSPLTRGKHRGFSRADQHGGLIPAHAGKTRSTPAPGTGSRAHPRSRGENLSALIDGSGQKGSSPLTRGKLDAAATTAASARLIPAHAGKTTTPAAKAESSAAHPRSRGEND